MNKLLSIFALWSITISYAQDALFAEVDKEIVGVNEQFTYTITSTKNCEIAPPRFRGLQVVAGPIQGQSSHTSIINNVQTNTNEYTFTYYLRAKEMGIYTIESSEMECKKKSYSTGEIKIKVMSADELAAEREGIADHYLTLESNKSEVYEGEPFILSLKFYSKKRPTDVENYVNGVSSGLERQDLRKPTDAYQIMQQNIKGSRYYIIELRKEICIPLRSGEIEIEPSYGSMWFNQGVFESYRLDGYTNSLTINAKPLPEESPKNYIGLVGDFEMEFEMDKSTVKANQSLEMKMTLRGTGNFNSFDPPIMNLPEGLELYSPDPEIKDTIVAENNGLSGERTFIYTVLAKKKGDYELQPFNFSYFDLRRGRFDSLYTDKLNLEVTKGSRTAVEVPQSPVKVDTTDIRFISTNEGIFFKEDDFVYGSLSYYIALTGPIILSVFVVFFIRRRANLTEDEKLAIVQKAAKKSSIKGLDEARSLLAAGNEKQALTSLQSSLFSFFTTKLNMQMSELSKSSVAEKLKAQNVSADQITEFEDCWSKIEMAQYAPVDGENISSMIETTEGMINSMNSVL